MVKDKLVHFCDRDFECVDEGFGENTPVDVVIRPEDLYIFPGVGYGTASWYRTIVYL